MTLALSKQVSDGHEELSRDHIFAGRDSSGHAAARVYALPEHTPLCTACGLILCTLRPPHRARPHCAAPLFTPPALSALIAKLEELRDQTLAEEAAESRASA
ncbi:hypothetical protein F5148DRAFT_1289815 [Russula earlei]|uniref:Uncharacterized protein n=1 Tax=Russula earlei TaxID=71964 RepID=A0ACC0TY66_9AGAM|nr:hypothetical protein F5148DRAFT_1289815 [Russula earlei]